MSRASELIGHLNYCRQRANLMGVLGLAALLAWWALPGPDAQPGLLPQAYIAKRELLSQKWRLFKIRLDVATWAAKVPREKIGQTSHVVSRVGSELERLGISAHWASFFTVPARIGPLLQAAERLTEKPLAVDASQWSRRQLDDLATLLGYRAQGRWQTEIADVRAARAELERARADAAGVALAKEGLEALDGFERAVREFDASPLPADLKVSGQMKQLAARMEGLGMSGLGALELAGEARRVTKSLREGSLSVLGFTVPGLVVRLMVPALALGLAIDLLIGSLRTAAFARRAVSTEEASAILAGFPWGAARSRALGSGRDGGSGLGGASALPLLLSLAAIIPLTAAGDANTAAAGLVLLLASGCAAVAAVRTVAQAAGASAPLQVAAEGVDLRLALAKEQLEGVNSAVALTTVACVTTLSFFLAFLLVPSSLLQQGDRVAGLVETRDDFDRAYVQRLREQEKTFAEWCEAAGCKPWAQFSFAASATPASHPAALVLNALSEHPIVLAQMSATSRVKDLLTESRARLQDLDQGDVNEVMEILYRSNIAPVVALMGEVQRLNVGTPLPAAVLDRLPNGVRNAPTGVTVPFAFPYRTMVERAGFADRLRSLPSEDRVQAWLEFMTANGLDRVRGFDAVGAALGELSGEIGKTKLKIAGVEVQRSIASTVALVVLALVTIGLAARVRGARGYMRSLPAEEAELAMGRTPGIILMRTESNGWAERVLAFACCTLPGLAAGVVLQMPSGSSTSPAVGAVLLALTCAAAIVLAVERQRLVSVVGKDCRKPA